MKRFDFRHFNHQKASVPSVPVIVRCKEEAFNEFRMEIQKQFNLKHEE